MDDLRCCHPAGLCFGAGLGITLFGISYMFIHDGLVHKRFPVGPIADVPYLKRVAIAHKLHHSEKYGGVPWGLFLGPHVRLPHSLTGSRAAKESFPFFLLGGAVLAEQLAITGGMRQWCLPGG